MVGIPLTDRSVLFPTKDGCGRQAVDRGGFLEGVGGLGTGGSRLAGLVPRCGGAADDLEVLEEGAGGRWGRSIGRRQRGVFRKATPPFTGRDHGRERQQKAEWGRGVLTPGPPKGKPAQAMAGRVEGMAGSISVPGGAMARPRRGPADDNRLDALDPAEREDCLADGLRRSAGGAVLWLFSLYNEGDATARRARRRGYAAIMVVMALGGGGSAARDVSPAQTAATRRAGGEGGAQRAARGGVARGPPRPQKSWSGSGGRPPRRGAAPGEEGVCPPRGFLFPPPVVLPSPPGRGGGGGF